MSETKAPLKPDFSKLSNIERAVVVHIANGLTARQAAKAMNRSEKTVDWHKAQIFRKLNVANATQLVRLAVFGELVPVEYEVPAES